MRLLYLLLSIIVCAGSLLHAQRFLPFQGKVFDANDQPVSGQHTFEFSITDGGVLWSEIHDDITVYEGIYAVVLGSVTPLPDGVFANTPMHTLQVRLNGALLADVDLYRPIENDPTLPDELRDGVDWEDIKDPPVLTGESAVPIGTVLPYSGFAIPDGWLECDGAELSRLVYPALFDAIGTRWGGDASPNFALPDLRGVFLRGVNGSRDDIWADPDADQRVSIMGGTLEGVGSYQSDQFGEHNHNRPGYGLVKISVPNTITTVQGTDDTGSGFEPSLVDKPQNMNSAGGLETRPKNAAVYFIIKAE